MSTLLVTIRTPRGPVDLSIPADLDGAGLVAMLAPTLGEPASGSGWQLTTFDHAIELAPQQTLEEAGILDGTILQLQPIGIVPQADVPAQPQVSVVPHDRSARVIPRRVNRWERIGIALGAVSGAHVPPDATGLVDRVVKAWHWTDHRRRLEWLVSRPRLQRTVIVGVVGHRSIEISQSIATELTRVRHDRIVLIAERAPFQHSGGPSTDFPNLESIDSGLRRANISSIERDALFARTEHGALLIPLDRSTPPPDVATFRRLLESLASHAGVVIIDAGTSESPASTTTDFCDQIIYSTTGPRRKLTAQTIVATWGNDPSEDSAEPYASVRVGDDPESMLELAVVSVAGWAQFGAATPVPLGL